MLKNELQTLEHLLLHKNVQAFIFEETSICHVFEYKKILQENDMH